MMADTEQQMIHIAIATSTRADWGLLAPVASALKARPDVCLSIIATNMHLDPDRGMTVDEIIADGFEVAVRVPMPLDAALPQGVAQGRAMAQCLGGMVNSLASLNPDILLLLGDRYEMLATASAAAILRIPVAHISGGEVTLGAIDDSFRHAISKLASLHFPTTDSHRQRLINMGEPPELVVNAGALGDYNFRHIAPMSREQLEASIGFKITDPTLLITYHPATTDSVAPTVRFRALLDALDRFPGARFIFTYPNNDPGSEGLIAMIEEFVAAAGPDRAVAIPSLGRLRYLSALKYVDAVVGNSSSGVVEVPSAGTPVVNIGIRQQGRTCSEAVIHCGDSADDISAAIAYALTPEARNRAQATPNPYSNPDTVNLIVNKLLSTPISSLLPKRFYDNL